MNTTTYRGNDKVLIGFILGLLSFWLFAMTLLNIQYEMNADLGLENSTLSFAVSITSLVSGVFIVVLGGLADRYGRRKILDLGFIFGFIGSLLIAFTPASSVLSAPMLILGRIFQGLSGACIMPSSLALLNVYWDERGRQRAVSLWSMGSWGGTSFAALVGGLMAASIGWRAIFILSAIFCLIGYLLVHEIPDSKAVSTGEKKKFDLPGFLTFMVFVVALQLFVAKGAEWGWGDARSLVLLGVSVLFFILFVWVEKRSSDPFVDFTIFKNSTFTGATISNFILNSTAGIIAITLSLIQLATNFGTDVAGYLTIGYGVSILLFIRVGEKLLQRFGPRKPMLWGCFLLLLSVVLLMQSGVKTSVYMVLMVIAFILFGTGLAFYATPSTDAALSSLPKDKSGSGSGLYKMASSLGAAFGLAISLAIYNSIISTEGIPVLNTIVNFVGRQDNVHLRQAGMVAIGFNLVMILLAILSIVLTVPKGKKTVTPKQ